MPKKSRDKGARYERKIAKIFGEAFKRDLRRVPLSGGLDIKCDIYDPFHDDFPLFIECKHRESFRIQSIIDGTSELYEVYFRNQRLSEESYLVKKYDRSPFPIVVFKGGDFKIDMVMCQVEHPESAISFYIGNWVDGHEVFITTLEEFIRWHPQDPLILNYEVNQEDDGDPD